MRHIALIAAQAVPLVFANTNAGSKLFVCATPQQAALTQAGYEALPWVQVKGVGNFGETGSSTNILNYDTWDDDVIQKAKGLTNAGDPTIEVARNPADPGQIIMLAIADTRLNYAFKIEQPDKQTLGGTGTIRYNRGLVSGPTQPNGRNEDFDLDVFTLGLQQKQIRVNANPSGAGNGPLNTAIPTITGTATVGQTLTATTGTFTGDATITYSYQWYAGGVPIAGANLSTYQLTSNELGDKISVKVVATNSAGTAEAMSIQTAAVA